MIPRNAYMCYHEGTRLERKFPVTWPVSTFYTQCPESDMVMSLIERGIRIGGDHSIIKDGDVVMNRTTWEIAEIDYFHGWHPMRFTPEGETVERTVPMPVAQMVLLDDEGYEVDWLVGEMVLITGWLMYRYEGPYCKAVRTVQRYVRMRQATMRVEGEVAPQIVILGKKVPLSRSIIEASASSKKKASASSKKKLKTGSGVEATK